MRGVPRKATRELQGKRRSQLRRSQRFADRSIMLAVQSKKPIRILNIKTTSFSFLSDRIVVNNYNKAINWLYQCKQLVVGRKLWSLAKIIIMITVIFIIIIITKRNFKYKLYQYAIK